MTELGVEFFIENFSRKLYVRVASRFSGKFSRVGLNLHVDLVDGLARILG